MLLIVNSNVDHSCCRRRCHPYDGLYHQPAHDQKPLCSELSTFSPGSDTNAKIHQHLPTNNGPVTPLFLLKCLLEPQVGANTITALLWGTPLCYPQLEKSPRLWVSSVLAYSVRIRFQPKFPENCQIFHSGPACIFSRKDTVRGLIGTCYEGKVIMGPIFQDSLAGFSHLANRVPSRQKETWQIQDDRSTVCAASNSNWGFDRACGTYLLRLLCLVRIRSSSTRPEVAGPQKLW